MQLLVIYIMHDLLYKLYMHTIICVDDYMLCIRYCILCMYDMYVKQYKHGIAYL